ncbi:MAG: patatin-like phospholipase family protein [Geodermatophilaceae bacterium]|nr:patatin-like phospholipase family protein [Geodermatophilaceae bacterium]
MLDAVRREPPYGSETPGRTVLVLGGGGALGAYQAGGLLALLEAGVVPDAMFGCSAGALNAAFLATEPTVDRAEQLRAWWLDPRTQHLLAPSGWSRVRGIARSIAAGARSLLDPGPLRRIIEEHVPAHELSELQIPLTITTTCLDCSAPRHHSHGPMAETLLASSALPGLFPPVRLPAGLDGNGCRTTHLHVDGGVLCGVPLTAALAAAGPTDRIIVFDCGLAPVTWSQGRCAAAVPADVIPGAAVPGEVATLVSEACGLTPVLPGRRYVAPVEQGRGLVDVVLRAFTAARSVANRVEIADSVSDPRVLVMPHVADAYVAGLLDELPSGPRDFRSARVLADAGHAATRQRLSTELAAPNSEALELGGRTARDR